MRRFIYLTNVLCCAGLIWTTGCNADQQSLVSDSDFKTAIEGTRLQVPEKMISISTTLVDGKLQFQKGAQEAPNSINRRDPYKDSNYYFEALDAEGKVLSRRGIRVEKELRGEWMNDDGEMEGVKIEIENPQIRFNVPNHSELATVKVFRKENNQVYVLGEVIQ